MFNVDDDYVEEEETTTPVYVYRYTRGFPPRVAFSPEAVQLSGGMLSAIINQNIEELFSRAPLTT